VRRFKLAMASQVEESQIRVAILPRRRNVKAYSHGLYEKEGKGPPIVRR